MNDYCDPETGLCKPSSLNDLSQIGNNLNKSKIEIIYVGDPMCSWCYGISPALLQLRDHFAKEMSFRIIVGGLRPGGGDPWNDEMKGFLKHHWEEVNARSGQPFGYKLFDLDHFDYNTEPSCRAIVAARPLVKHREMEFFEAVQRKFYFDSQDPKHVNFYASICDEFDINFGDFSTRFESSEVYDETVNEFNLNRSWGVKGYPSVILLYNDQLYQIAAGYSSFAEMKKQIEQLLHPTI